MANQRKKGKKSFKELLAEYGDDEIIDITKLDSLRNFFPEIDDEGLSKLKINKEGLFSSTPIGILCKYMGHLREKGLINDFRRKTLIDCTANMGLSALGFALFFSHVYAVEIDVINYELMTNNLAAFGWKNITPIFGDIFDIYSTLSYDVAFIDPPWGGPDYKEKAKLELYLGEKSLSELIGNLRNRLEIIILKVPKNYDIDLLNQFESIEVVDSYDFRNIRFIYIKC